MTFVTGRLRLIGIKSLWAMDIGIVAFPGKWLFISTQSGQLGYVARDHGKTTLPRAGVTFRSRPAS